MNGWMVFNALDGSPLDSKTLSFQAARASFRRLIVAGIPVVPIDVAFLSLADIPIIMPRRNGAPDPLLVAMLPESRIAPSAGPEGWAKAIDEISDSLTSRVGSA